MEEKKTTKATAAKKTATADKKTTAAKTATKKTVATKTATAKTVEKKAPATKATTPKTTAKKVAIGDYLADAMNGKTVKYIIRTTGIEVYIDNTKLELPSNTILDSSKTYYFGLRHTCSNTSTQCSKMLYMGPIR